MGNWGGPTSVGRRGGRAQMRHAMPAETAGGKPGRALPPRRSSQQESSHVKGRPPAAAESAGGVPTSHAHRPAKAVPHACRAAPARWSLMPWAALGKGAMGTALHRGDFRTRNRAARRVQCRRDLATVLGGVGRYRSVGSSGQAPTLRASETRPTTSARMHGFTGQPAGKGRFCEEVLWHRPAQPSPAQPQSPHGTISQRKETGAAPPMREPE